MFRALLWFGCLACLRPLPGAELFLDFNRFAVDAPPPAGFQSVLAGSGMPGEWRIVLDEVPSLISGFGQTTDTVRKKPVLAQVSRDPTGERFPMLVYDKESFGDFELTTRFKLVSGDVERMAGIAFRFQDPGNYYYIRASGKGNTFNFFKVMDGIRSPPIGNTVEITSGAWHELAIHCRASKIKAFFNGKEVLPELDDKSFASGKIAFWTKSDSVTHFTDTRIVYTPRLKLADILIRDAMRKFDRLEGIQFVAPAEGSPTPVIVASTQPGTIGQPGWPEEAGVISHGKIYQKRSDGLVSVSMPLRDRNGMPIAAARIDMKSFAGQTEKNALARAQNVLKFMEPRVLSLKELLE